MSCPALVIRNLKITYPAGGRDIISDLSFSVPGGTTVALVGESGSGKTMLSMAVMGLLPTGIYRNGGTITIDHQPTEGLSFEEYRRLRQQKVALVMQNPMSAFNPTQSIYYHFKETLASHGPSKSKKEILAQAMAGLAEMGFEDPGRILELYPFQMSGGMLQRVMLALSLILSPPLVIADEVTTDLDLVSQARVLSCLRDHCRQHHLALLLITHDLSVAAHMADHIVVIKQGRLVEEGLLKKVFTSPSSPYTQELLALHRELYSPKYQKIMSSLREEVL